MLRIEDGDAIASETDGTYHSMISQGHLTIFLRSDSRPAQIAEAWQHVLIVAIKLRRPISNAVPVCSHSTLLVGITVLVSGAVAGVRWKHTRETVCM